MTQLPIPDSSDNNDNKSYNSSDIEKMMESFIILEESQIIDENNNNNDNNDNTNESSISKNEPIEDENISVNINDKQEQLSSDVFNISESTIQNNDNSDINNKFLTDSILNISQKSDNGLHMSRFFPALVDRIQEQIKTDFANEDCNILKAAPQSTFILPNLSYLSKDIQKIIETDLFQRAHLLSLEKHKIINWNKDLTPLVPLNTQGDGNCLMHAISLGMYGVHDRQLSLRNALYKALTGNGQDLFKKRWLMQASNINRGSKISQDSLENEWNMIIKESSPLPVNPNSIGKNTYQYLGQMHIFVMANILRRPIIVYAESKARDLLTEESIFELPSDERIDGIYLPLLLPKEAIRKEPLVLAFHSSHFAPLVATLPEFIIDNEFTGYSAYYALVDSKNIPLPVHYLDKKNGEDEQDILHKFLDITQTKSNIPVAEQFHAERPEAFIALLDRYISNIKPSMDIATNVYAPQPCKNNCGFTGTSATKGFCSVCYKKQTGPRQCKLRCGFFASVGDYCSSCSKKQQNTPISILPNITTNFNNVVDLFQPLYYIPNNTQRQQYYQQPYHQTKPKPTQRLCKAINCTFHAATSQGYCSVCFKRYNS